MKFQRFIGALSLIGIVLALPGTAWAWTYTPASTEDVVSAPHMSADGKYMVVLSDVKKKTFDQVLFFNTGSSKPAWTYSPTEMTVSSDISGNGKYVAAVGSKIWLFKKESNKPVWSVKAPQGVIDAVSLNTAGNRMAVGDRSSTVRLYSTASSKALKSWNVSTREDGILSVSISSNGKKILAGTHEAVYLIDVAKNRAVWRYATKSHLEMVRLSADGKYAVATDKDTLYYFDTTKKTPTWTQKIKSFYPLIADISDNGGVATAGTTKNVYAFNSKGAELWHYDMPSGLKGELSVTGNGRYTMMSQGSSYIYLFDNAYGSGNRPFRFYTGNRPRYVGMSQSGDKIAYGRYDLTATTPPPGILADQQSLPVYLAGMNLKLRVFATNPGTANPNLKVKVALSLPQINWWDSLAAQKEATSQQPGTRMKAIQYAAEALPGYSEIYNEPYAPSKNSSLDTTLNLEVPSLVMPQWLNDLLGTLNNILPFDDLMGDWSDSIDGLLGTDATNKIVDDANDSFAVKDAIFPLLGVGTVMLYDSQTNVVYDTDSFYFIFGLGG